MDDPIFALEQRITTLRERREQLLAAERKKREAALLTAARKHVLPNPPIDQSEAIFQSLQTTAQPAEIDQALQEGEHQDASA